LLSAIQAYRQALGLGAFSPAILLNLANALLAVGDDEEGLAMAKAAYLATPRLPATGSNYLFSTLYSSHLSPEEVAAAHREWGSRFPAPPTLFAPRRPGRLRLAYLSSYFSVSPEARFLEPLVCLHDRKLFEVSCYSGVANQDEQTALIRSKSDRWRDIANLSDEEACNLVKQDEIDILVDCTGHFGQGRLALLALKPAPIQVSYPTYSATTGLETVDYRLSDRWADPPGLTEHLHTETIIRLPGSFICYRAHEDAPDPSGPPVLRKGRITFGCFNRFEKLNPRVIRTWAAVLNAVPHSHMLLHQVFRGHPKPTSEYCKPILLEFARNGIPSHRIHFVGARPVLEHLALHSEVDIMLDPYPFSGMTTTCASLWMGVPVLTLCGRSFVSRTAASLLQAADLPDWIADSEEQYVDLAVARARDGSSLARLRSELRDRMRASPLLDAPGYTRNLEVAYWQMAVKRWGDVALT
jgi:predicted O-linked N-acetylglucosamine transferase (SPINDLY family)